MDSGIQNCQIPMPIPLRSIFPQCLFKKLLTMVKVGYLVAAADGTILYLNQACSEMFQMDMQEAVGSNMCRYFPNSRLLTVMRTGIADEGIVFPYKGRSAFISRYPIFHDGVVVGGYIEIYCRDITQLGDLAHRVQCLERKVRLYQERVDSPSRARYTFNDLIGQAKVMEDLKARARKYAQADLPVLIFGETGTGKELMAHSLHSASPRAHGPFVTLNCEAIPENLLESELFGYEEGTFTGARQGGYPGKFELADGGTIFLDEISTLSLALQAKLLRVIESKEIQKLGKWQPVSSDFRLVAATNEDLWKAVDKGLFRRDLLYRLCQLFLHMPPLRERKEDIPLLVRHYLATMESEACGIRVHPEIMAALQNYAWPGNVRELRNVVNAAAISLDDISEDTILLQHLTHATPGGGWTAPPRAEIPAAGASRGVSLKEARSASERETIMATLSAAGGNKSRAASLLGISRNELYRKLRKYAAA